MRWQLESRGAREQQYEQSGAQHRANAMTKLAGACRKCTPWDARAVRSQRGDDVRTERCHGFPWVVCLVLCTSIGSLPAHITPSPKELTASEYDETTWSARTWMAFATQRLSVASQLSMAQEAAEALGLSVAADPRAQ